MNSIHPTARNQRAHGRVRPEDVPNGRRSTLWLGVAAVLILAGISLQLLGTTFAVFSQDNSWVLSVTIPALWHMLAEAMGRVAPEDVLSSWPLLPVLVGTALLLMMRTGRPEKQTSGARGDGEPL